MSLAALFATPKWLVGAISRRVSVSLPGADVDAEQQVPLHPFRLVDEDDEDDGQDDGAPREGLAAAAGQRRGKRPSTAPPRTSATRTAKRVVVAVVAAVSLYKLGVYLYSDPERWDQPWGDVFLGPATAVFPTLVAAAGQRYQGEADGKKVTAWRGIRYALPPTGKRRFRKAVSIRVPKLAAGALGEIVNATQYDDGCARPNPDGLEGFVGTEDCLTLNIHTPRYSLPGVKLPVMVWIHGGGFYAGKSSEDRYNPRDLLERSQRMNQPFVFVSINYRLNVLGFSSAAPEPGPPPIPPHIPVGPPEELDLNVGLKDQILALQWVRREIANWGGDRDKVTLVGHSAGAISVGLHQLYSPPELFRGAFMLSGAPTSFPIPFPHDGAGRTLHPLVEPAECPSPERRPDGPPSNGALVECLRDMPLHDLMRAAQGLFDRAPTNGYFPWYPVLEGEWEGSWLDIRPSDHIVRGTFSKVPVVMGSVRDEGTRFTSPDTASQDDILHALHWAFEFTFGAIETILTPIWELYPEVPSLGSPYQTGNETFGLAPSYKRLASILGDVFFQAPRRHFLRETPKDFGEPSWNFLYDEARAGALERNGAQHGADLNSWFGHPEGKDSELYHLSRHMTAYLINFVANLDPNGPGLRTWPQYGMDRRTLHLGRHNITITHDNARLEAMHFINNNNPLFAR